MVGPEERWNLCFFKVGYPETLTFFFHKKSGWQLAALNQEKDFCFCISRFVHTGEVIFSDWCNIDCGMLKENRKNGTAFSPCRFTVQNCDTSRSPH